MATKKLRDMVTKNATHEVIVKDALYGYVCDGCGKVFSMDLYCNDKPSEMIITFDRSRAVGGGNFAIWNVCSFACAEKVFNGKWKESDSAKGFRQYAKPVRATLCITPFIKNEEQLIKEWEEED